MLKYLFIAEKPSLMRDVKKCYVKHQKEIQQAVGLIDFVALSGHVCRNAEPKEYEEWNCPWDKIDYPMIPKQWMIQPIADRGKIKTLNDIKKNVKNYDGIIVGTDSDVEGYGIYYLLEHYLGIETMPALRFMEHSLTDKEILATLLHMTDFHKDPVHVKFTNSFLLRSKADWLYGMNCTSLMTLKQGRLMTVGRVKAPTIKLVYDNSTAIENFKPRKYYHILSDYGSFKGVMIDEKEKVIEFEHPKEMDLNSIPKQGKIIEVKKKEVYTHAPYLYELSALQVEIGQSLNMSPHKVLEIVQSLYEKHKVISYPRTQCCYVSSEKAREFPQMLKQMTVFPELAQYANKITQEDIMRVWKDKKVVNDTEVQKESHDALLPTDKTPVLSEMTKEESLICMVIYKRLLAQFLPPLTESKTKMILEHGTYRFGVQGKIILNQGWRVLYREASGNSIPTLEEGGSITTNGFSFQEKVTTPPRRLTQATLVEGMKKIANQIEDKELRKSLGESNGIGTSATRAEIIKDIIKRGYIEDKRGLYITQLGRDYIESLSGIDIISPIFAASLDTEIKKIQRGEEEYETVYHMMLENLKRICQQIDKIEPQIHALSVPCPNCGGTLTDKTYSYNCTACTFQMSKLICGQKITLEILEELCANKVTKRMKFKKKDGNTFEARIRLTQDGLKFDFSTGLSCPYCGNEVKKGQYGYYCSCGLKIPLVISSVLSEADLRKLLNEQYLPKKEGFKSKKGTTFAAALKLENKEVKFIFDT